ALELVYPARGDGVNRRRVEVVQLLAPAPRDGHEVRLLEEREVLGDCLAGHVERHAELAERLPVLGVEPIEQAPARLVGERPPNGVVIIGRHAAIYATVWLPMSSRIF